jgi:hypothetical protein
MRAPDRSKNAKYELQKPRTWTVSIFKIFSQKQQEFASSQ